MEGIKKIHQIELWVNNKLVDIYSQDDLNLRFNNSFVNPEKIETIRTEYSFSFSLPITKNNRQIFDYADTLAKRGKFNKRFPTHLNVDGLLIFDGELILTAVDDNGFKCNLYINKLNTIEKIFGESVMTDITDWKMDYNQAETINTVNSGNKTYPQDVFFPLVSYGMFQKLPYNSEQSLYTSKHLFDQYNRFYNENFYPSFNLLRLVEKCFEHKGYTVDGDIFDDDVLRKIYTSVKLKQNQDPLYNYGGDMGKLHMAFTYCNSDKTNDNRDTHIMVDLKEPMFQCKSANPPQTEYNLTTMNVYDVFNGSYLNFTEVPTNEILWRENRIVAPCDGYYKIKLNLTYDLRDNTEQREFYHFVNNNSDVRRGSFTQEKFVPINGFENYFTEFQLVKNSEDSLDCQPIFPKCIEEGMEINGKKFYYDTQSGTTLASMIDVLGLYGDYPHSQEFNNSSSLQVGDIVGYAPQNNKTLRYDPSVNPNFIMGCSSSANYNFTSVIKNGNTWKSGETDLGISRTNCVGYDTYGRVYVQGSRNRPQVSTELIQTNSDYGKDTLPNASNTIQRTIVNQGASTQVEAIVFLKKNDFIQLKMLTRQFINTEAYDSSDGKHYAGANYSDDAVVNVSGSIDIEMFAPSTLPLMSPKMDFNAASLYDTQLNIANFLCEDEKMSDFISNFIKEFNLSYSQNGSNITINKQKIATDKPIIPLDLTDRIKSDEIETQYIDFPSSVAVKYTINEDERGFYTSAEKNATEEQIQSNSWKDYADRGYDVIELSNDEYAENQEVQTKTSYNWYELFHNNVDDQNSDVNIPIIAKDEWMIDNLKDAEFMKFDGYNYNKRYWFPSDLTDSYVYVNKNKVYINLCSNTYNNTELSYKEKGENNSETLLQKYFNIFYDSDTNYIIFEIYLTTEEYMLLKNGSNIKIDDDVYIVTNIEGFDCSGNNKTKITAVKK